MWRINGDYITLWQTIMQCCQSQAPNMAVGCIIVAKDTKVGMKFLLFPKTWIGRDLLFKVIGWFTHEHFNGEKEKSENRPTIGDKHPILFVKDWRSKWSEINLGYDQFVGEHDFGFFETGAPPFQVPFGCATTWQKTETENKIPTNNIK